MTPAIRLFSVNSSSLSVNTPTTQRPVSDPNLAKSFESPLDSPIFRNHSSPTPFDSFDRSTSPTYPSKEPTLCEEERDDVGMQPLDVNTDDLIIEDGGGLPPLQTNTRLFDEDGQIFTAAPRTLSPTLLRSNKSSFSMLRKEEKVSGALDRSVVVFAPLNHPYPSDDRQSGCCCIVQ